jgi:S1-C subfamily serine protease
VNIVKKIVNDLIEFGDVKRGYLGISYSPNDNEGWVKRAGIKDGQGVYALAVPTDGAAYKAGLKKGDIITHINGNMVATGLQMSGQIASYKPGDKVKITYLRSGKEYTTDVVLSGELSKTDISNAEIIGDRLGVELETLDSKKADKYDIEGGVVVKAIKEGGPFSKTRMEQGFIITNVNGRDVKNIDELGNALGAGYGKVRFEGIYPGYNGVYTYEINLNDDTDY